MRRIRNIALLAAWAGLVWMLVARTTHHPLFDNFIFDFAYNVGAIAAAVVVVAATAIVIGRLFHPSAAIQLSVAAFLILVLAAADVFWLRGLIARP